MHLNIAGQLVEFPTIENRKLYRLQHLPTPGNISKEKKINFSNKKSKKTCYSPDKSTPRHSTEHCRTVGRDVFDRELKTPSITTSSNTRQYF